MGFTDLKRTSITNGKEDINISSPLTVFGEILVANLVPNAQGDFVNNINSQVFSTSSFANFARESST